MKTIINMRFITILSCIILTNTYAFSVTKKARLFSINTKNDIELYKIKLSKDQKRLEKTGPCSINIKQIILNNHTDSMNVYEVTYINDSIEFINWFIKKNESYYYFKYENFEFSVGFDFFKITEQEFHSYVNKKKRLIKNKDVEKKLILEEVKAKINERIDSSKFKILNGLLYVNIPIFLKEPNDALNSCYRAIYDSISSGILKYTEGYSQAYEIYLEDKTNEELDYLLNQYSTDTRWTNPPKAFVIAKVMYLRTGKNIYLNTLRNMYKVHNRLIKEVPPEFYEYEIIKAPFDDEYLLKKY